MVLLNLTINFKNIILIETTYFSICYKLFICLFNSNLKCHYFHQLTTRFDSKGIHLLGRRLR